MTINTWKTSFIGLNRPSKVLSGTADSYTSLSLWPYANGQDDPYWSGGINPQFYRWQVTFTVNERVHGSHLTRTPFRFNAQDIEVGDFVGGAQDGKVCQIISIISKTDTELVAVVEDNLRYNTFRDPTGFGLFDNPGPVIFFQINEMGYPMFDPVPGEAASDFADNVLSRFQYINPLLNYVLTKENNGFEQGDAVCIENEDFVLSDSSNIDKFMGTVVSAGPGPDQFILRPANGIIDFVPNLPGIIGDYIYPTMDGSGDLTTNDASRKPIYMKIAYAIPSTTIGTGVDPAPQVGEIVELNRRQITFSGTTLDSAITAINADTFYHKIVASKVGAATTTKSGDGGLGTAYGVVAGYTPFSASINGITVNFTTTVSGSAAYGDPTVSDVNDMIVDINNAGIPNIVASVYNGSELLIKNTVGGAITIVNIGVDANGNHFAGAGSITAIPLTTAANTTTHSLRLDRTDGGPLTIRDIEGTFLYRAGVMSGQTGRYALALSIEQGLRNTKTFLVANIMARDALNPIVGDQVHVADAGNGEWATFLWNGSLWLGIGNQRSDATDARTLTVDFNLSSINTTGITTKSLGHISAGRKVVEVKVLVTGACASNTTVKVRTAANEVLQDVLDSILSQAGSYKAESDYLTSGYTEVVADLNLPALGSGQFTVLVTYV